MPEARNPDPGVLKRALHPRYLLVVAYVALAACGVSVALIRYEVDGVSDSAAPIAAATTAAVSGGRIALGRHAPSSSHAFRPGLNSRPTAPAGCA